MRGSLRVLAVASLAAIALSASAEEVVVLGDIGQGLLVRGEVETGATSNTSLVSGLVDDESIEAIATGGPLHTLYGLTRSRLYRIDASTNTATPAGPRFEDQWWMYRRFAFLLHPVTGTARILRGTKPPGAGPDTGTTWMRLDPKTVRLESNDPGTGKAHALAYAAGDPNEGLGPVVTIAAYHPYESDHPTLYGIDTARATLVRVGPASDSGFTDADDVVTTIAPLSGLPEESYPVSIETQKDGTMLLLTGDGRLWSLDLATGAATARSTLTYPLTIDLALVPSVPVGPAQQLVVDRTRVVVNHRRRDADSVTVVGRIGVPKSGSWEGTTLAVDFGGIVREFAMDARGRGRTGRDSFRIFGKPENGLWSFTLSIHGADFGRALGIGSGDGLGVVNPVVDLFVRSADDDLLDVQRTSLTIGYKTKKGRTLGR